MDLPNGVARFVDRNISPPVESKVFHLPEWFRSRTNRSQRLITPPRRRRYLEFKALIVHLCSYKRIQHETDQSNRNMIYESMLVTKESSNIYMKSNINNIYGT